MKMKHEMNKNGFTLIELVVVIVILGVLAATAAPKFIDLTGDANKAVLNTLSGSIASAAKLVYAKSIIQAKHTEAISTADIDGDGTADIATKYGYPNAHRSEGIVKAIDVSASDWTWSGNGSNNVFYITTATLGKTNGQYVNTVNILASNCYLTYTGSTGVGATPVINFVDSGC
jgi:MSHA pilin protein MshA